MEVAASAAVYAWVADAVTNLEVKLVLGTALHSTELPFNHIRIWVTCSRRAELVETVAQTGHTTAILAASTSIHAVRVAILHQLVAVHISDVP